MGAGQLTQGRRLPDNSEISALERVGDYFLKDEPDGKVLWGVHPCENVEGDLAAGYVRIPSPMWSIVENPDGTVTANPSIWVNKPHGWHGYLECGVWREV